MGATNAGRFDRSRREAVECLDLRAADTVLEVGCETPVCTALIAERIWPGGRLVCVADPAALARVRDAVEGFENVALVESPVGSADLPQGFDAALFSGSEELRSEPAVANVLGHLHLGARIAAFGVTCPAAGRFDPPWGILERHVPHLTVRRRALTGAYVACGTLERAPAAAVTK